MRIELGYPDRDAERTLLQGADRRDMIAGLDAASAGRSMDLQAMVKTVHAGAASRLHPGARRALAALARVATGLSPRAALALLHASRAWALIEGATGRPEDVQAVLPGSGHRLGPCTRGSRSSVEKATGLISAVPIP